MVEHITSIISESSRVFLERYTPKQIHHQTYVCIVFNDGHTKVIDCHVATSSLGLGKDRNVTNRQFRNHCLAYHQTV